MPWRRRQLANLGDGAKITAVVLGDKRISQPSNIGRRYPIVSVAP